MNRILRIFTFLALVITLAAQFKPAWFTLDEIKANLEAAYHPGERQGNSQAAVTGRK